jgi:hypothetical protein
MDAALRRFPYGGYAALWDVVPASDKGAVKIGGDKADLGHGC